MDFRKYAIATAVGCCVGTALGFYASDEMFACRAPYAEECMVLMPIVISLVLAISLYWWDIHPQAIFVGMAIAGLATGSLILDRAEGATGGLECVSGCSTYALILVTSWGLGRVIRRFRFSHGRAR